MRVCPPPATATAARAGVDPPERAPEAARSRSRRELLKVLTENARRSPTDLRRAGVKATTSLDSVLIAHILPGVDTPGHIEDRADRLLNQLS
jgi:hypothetical protein